MKLLGYESRVVVAVVAGAVAVAGGAVVDSSSDEAVD